MVGCSRSGFWSGLKLFDDEPKRNAGRSDPCRQRNVAETLARLIREAIDARKGRDRATCIGLFGGFGQGKSSILLQAIADLKERPPTSLRTPFRYHFFDTAHFKNEVLEFEFDRIVGRWSIYSLLRKAVVIFILLSLAVASVVAVVSWPISVLLAADFTDTYAVTFKSGGVATIFGVLGWLSVKAFWTTTAPTAGWVLRDAERKSNMIGAWRPGELRDYFRCPTVLIVDNLDRATVQQQRALLRSIRKHSEQLRLPVIVSMDEVGLLQSDPDPESPAELLRKTIHVECRLPLRVPEDIVTIIHEISNEGAKLNAMNPARTIFQNDHIVADWVRLFCLLSEMSPRRVKRFLNDLLLLSRQLGVEAPDDIAALSRLLGLLDIMPALRRMDERLIEGIAGNDWGRLDAILTDAGIKPSDELRRFFELTRHMQPRYSFWRELAGSLADIGKTPSDWRQVHETFDALTAVGQGFVAGPGLLRRSLPKRGQGDHGHSIRNLGDEELPEEITTRPFTVGPHDPLFVMEATLAHLAEPRARLNIYKYCQFEFNRAAAKHLDDSWSQRFRHLLRLWLGDGEVLALLSPEERHSLLSVAYQTEGCAPLLLLVPGPLVSVENRAMLAANTKLLEARDLPFLRVWLADLGNSGNRWDRVFMGKIGTRLNIGLVEQAWPSLDLGENWEQDLRRHFTALGNLTLAGIALTPPQIAEDLFFRGGLKRILRSTKCFLRFLDAAQLLLPEGIRGSASQVGVNKMAWALESAVGTHVTYFDVIFRSGNPYIGEFLSIIGDAMKATSATAVRQYAPVWWAFLFLACKFRDEAFIRIWIKSCVGRLDCPYPDLVERLIRQESNPLWSVLDVGAVRSVFAGACSGYERWPGGPMPEIRLLMSDQIATMQ